MRDFFELLLGRWPLGILGGSIVLSLVTGTSVFFLLGLVAAGLVAAAAMIAPGAQSTRRLAKIVDKISVERVKNLRTRLRQSAAKLGGNTLPLEAIDQLENANDRMLAFIDTLSQRFERSELAFGRYHQAAEQVYLSLFDGLERLATELEGAASADPQALRSRLRRATKAGEKTEHMDAQLQSASGQVERAKQLLAENDRALSELSSATSKLASLTTGRGLADNELESAMGQLTRLADQSTRYQLSEPKD